MEKTNPAIYTHSFKSSIGTIFTASTDNGLAYLGLPGSTKSDMNEFLTRNFPNHSKMEKGKYNLETEKQISQYLDGKRRDFDLELELTGTDFQKKVLKKVASVKYGQTKKYAEIASMIKNPKAFRAVGSANAKNVIPIIIPCHRIVAGNGLGGYAGGLKLKEKLLNMELHNS